MLTTTSIPFRVRFARARPALGYRGVFVCLSGLFVAGFFFVFCEVLFFSVTHINDVGFITKTF